MPIEFQIHEPTSLKVVNIFGHAHLQELLKAAENFLLNPIHKDISKFYVDLNGLEDAKASFAEVYKLCGLYRRGLSRRKRPISVAIVAPTKLGLGISRMFASIMAVSSVMNVKIFKNEGAALEWLEIDQQQISNTLNASRKSKAAKLIRSVLRPSN